MTIKPGYFAIIVALMIHTEPKLHAFEIQARQSVQTQLHETGSARVIIHLKSNSGSTIQKPVNLSNREISEAQSNLLSTLTSQPLQVEHRFTSLPAIVATVSSFNALAALVSHPQVEAIELDAGGMGTESGGSGSLSSSVLSIGGRAQHETGNTGLGTTIAVIDSGVESTHSNLFPRVVAEACFLDAGGVGLCSNGSGTQFGHGAANDLHGHGTHVTGIIASNGSIGSAGLAPSAEIVAIRVLDSDNRFYFFSEIVAALEYIDLTPELGVQVINMSLGTFIEYIGECDNSGAGNMLAAAVISRLVDKGITVFASSGNTGSIFSMPAPACLSQVISVGAVNSNNQLAGFTSTNSTTNLLAPGVDITSSWLGNALKTASGTSMASAHAAGCAALVINEHSQLTPAMIEQQLNSPFIPATTEHDAVFPVLTCFPSDTRYCNGLPVSVDLAAGELPTVGDDVILGTSNADQIMAFGGDDTICGGGGNDYIIAGGGDDWIDSGDGSDVVEGGAGNDYIAGGRGSDTIHGGSGDDIISAGTGDDVILGQIGDDIINGERGNDAIDAGPGNDFVYGGVGNDHLTGGSGADLIKGGNGADQIDGGSGDDVVTGGNGRDIIYGGDGNDRINGQQSRDELHGGEGSDSINGGAENDTINGNAGDDLLEGGPGDDVIRGDEGQDHLRGGAGNDTLAGGVSGGDICDGQSGSDTSVASCEANIRIP